MQERNGDQRKKGVDGLAPTGKGRKKHAAHFAGKQKKQGVTKVAPNLPEQGASAEIDAVQADLPDSTETLGYEVSPDAAASESDIASLIDEYKAAVSAKNAAKVDSLGVRLKAALGMHQSQNLSSIFSAGPSGPASKSSSGGTGSSSVLRNNTFSSSRNSSPLSSRLNSAFATPYQYVPRPNVIAVNTYTPETVIRTPPMMSGSVTDGLISGATVFLDLDGDRELDKNEVFTTTDAQGNYTLPFQNGTIVAFGGTDIATGLANKTVFTAPAGYQHISPITTIMQAMVDSGKSVSEAEATVKTQYGLGDVDLKNTDPIGGLDGSNSEKSLTVLNKAVQTANTANQIAAMMQGAAPALSSADALNAAYAALGAALDAGGRFDDITTIKTAIITCATGCGIDVTGFADKAAKIMADSNNLLDNATGNGQAAMDAATVLAKVAKLAQETISAGMKTAVESGDPRQMDTLETDYTSTNLVNAADTVTAGDIDGDGQAESGGTLNNAPIQTLRTGTVWDGVALDADKFFSVRDPEGNAIDISFMDKTSGGGFFTLDGTNPEGIVNQWDGGYADGVDSLMFAAGTAGGSDTVAFQSTDDLGWQSTVAETTVYTSTSSVSDGAANALTGIDATTLFSVTNASANELTYWVRDDAGSGHFTKDGTTYNSGGWQNIGTSLAGLTYMAGNPLDGTDEVQFKAMDAFGNESAVRTSTITVTNTAPVVSANQDSITVNANGTVNIQNLFSVSDAEGDAVPYFWFKTTSDEGYFSRTTTSNQVDADNWMRLYPIFDNMTYTASNPTDGKETISFRVMDSFGNMSNAVDVTVNVINQGPVGSLNGTLTGASALDSYDMSSYFSATDPEGDALTYFVRDTSAAGYFYIEGGAEFSEDGWHEVTGHMANLRYMTGNPDNEIDTLQWKAVDSFGNEDITTMNVALTNDAPVIEGPTTFSANQHEAIESGSLFIASDPEGDALTYWVADKAPFQYGGGHFVIDGVAIEDTNGWLEVGTDPSKIVWMTGHPADGDEVFKIMAKDSHGNLSNIIEVTNVVNRPPTISASQLTLEADAYGTIDISSIFTASDIDGDAIQRIWVKTSSDAAYISRSTTSHQVDADDWESIQPRFDNLTYTAGNPPGIKNADNTWSKGTETLWVRVTDINGATSNEIELTVTVNNDAPVSDGPTTLYINEGGTIDLLPMFMSSDPEGDNFSYWIADNSTEASGNGYLTINGVSKEADNGWINVGANPTELTWHANGGTIGTVQEFTFRAVDDHGNEGNALNVEVTVSDNGPTITGPTSFYENQNTLVSLAGKYTAFDPEGDSFTYYVAEKAPQQYGGGDFVINGEVVVDQTTWLEVGTTLDNVQWQTGSTADGDELFLIRAKDSNGNWGNAVYVDMNMSRTPTAEAPTSLEAYSKTAIDLMPLFIGTDPDGDALSYWLYDNSDGYYTVDGVSKEAESGWFNAGSDISSLTWTTGNSVDNHEGIAFRVEDTFGNKSDIASTDITLTNRAPVLDGQTILQANQNTLVDLSSIFSAVDPEGDALEYWVCDAAASQYGGGYFVINGVPQTDKWDWFKVGPDFSDVKWHTGTPSDGDETFKVRAVDSRGNIGNTFIVDMNVNRPPEVSVNTASITVDALGTADISTIFSVLDLDQDEIKKFWFKTSSDAGYISRSTTTREVDCDDWESVFPTSRNLTYTAGHSKAGVETVYFKAEDQFGNMSDVVELTVNTTNYRPVITAPTYITVAKDTTFSLADFVSAVDPEGQSLKWVICDTSETTEADGYLALNGTTLSPGWRHVGSDLSSVTWTTNSTPGGKDWIKIVAQDEYNKISSEHWLKINVVDEMPSNLESPSDILNGNNADGSVLVRNIDSVGDVDWFATTMTAGKSYIFQAEGMSTFGTGLTDPTMSLYYVDGSGKSRLVKRNDDGGQGTNSWLSYTPRSQELSTGNFYIEVSSGNSGTGNYMVSASTATGSADLTLEGKNLNMWGNGAPATITKEAYLFNCNIKKEGDISFSSKPLDFSAKPYLDFSAALGAGIKIDSGTMDFSQGLDIDFDLCKDITAGTDLVIDTSDWDTDGHLGFNTTSPNFAMWAGLDLAFAAGLKDLHIDSVVDYDQQLLSFVDTKLKLRPFDLDPDGNLEYESDFKNVLKDILDVKATVPQFGNTAVTYQRDGNSNDLGATRVEGTGNSFATFGLDIDGILSKLTPIPELSGGEKFVDKGPVKVEWKYDWLDVKAELAIKPVQELTAWLAPTDDDLDLTFTTYKSQADKNSNNVYKTYTGTLGDVFTLDTPDDQDGTMVVDVDFNIGGNVSNKSGLQFEGGAHVSALSLEFKAAIDFMIAEASVGFKAGPLLDYNPMWNIGSPLYLWNETTHYDSLVSGSYSYTVDYHDRSDIFDNFATA